MSTQCIQVTMKSLKQLLLNCSPEVVVSIRGRHAVGKSEAVGQFAEELGLPLQMRRLSQMTEGDLLGVPSLTETANGGSATKFNPCEWFIEACEKPMVLFLDERNRALDAVKQSIFEICDSRQFYGHHLHPETRVIIAENVGDAYQVTACDPAEVSRTVTVELEPSLQEWLDYAKGKCHEATVEFIRSEGEKVLEFKGANGAFEPNKKYPDRRSWFKLDRELVTCGLMETPEEIGFHVMACGFLGTEVGTKFANYCKSRDKQVSAKDILTNWKKAKARLSSNGKKEITNEKYVELGNKLSDYLAKPNVKVTDAELDNFTEYLGDSPAEPRLALFSSFHSNPTMLVRLQPKIAKLMVDTANGVNKAEEEKKAAEAAAAAAATKKK